MRAAVVAAMAFGFVSVTVSVDVPLVEIEAGENALVTVGGVAVTVSVAFAAVVLAGPLEVTAPAAIVFP